MKIREKYAYVIRYFEEHMPAPKTELNYRTPFELVVAVILSAQCTDKRVNSITPALFDRFPDAGLMATASPGEIFELIKSCSYPNNKAKNLLGMARELVERFGGKVPADNTLLMSLPGVGRKTANVIASVLFNKPAMAVDTHVFRVSARIGLTNNAKTPLEAERQLTLHFPQNLLAIAHHWLILHGRYTCTARKPNCPGCGLTAVCNYWKKANRVEITG